ncbi:LppM family (lipo)protein, partial [uncultured Demequina sp.]|uniref:LppM family (lipo)protein n=1 Tax=uncultured Demequina sp. TaxID=693499 RepID=UPI0025D79E5C
MKSAARIAAMSVVSALVLAGCLRVEMSITLNEDDTATGEFVMAVSSEVAALMGEEEFTSAFSADEIEGSTTEPYESEDEDGDGEPDFVGSVTTFDSIALDDISDSTMAFTREGDEFVVSGTPADPSEDLGGEELTGAEATLSVTFPGEVSEHNGSLEGTTVTWDLLNAPDQLEARGSATADGGGIPLWIILVVLGVMGIGIGVAIVLITSTRRKSDDADSAREAEAQAGMLASGSMVMPAADVEPAAEEPPVAPT